MDIRTALKGQYHAALETLRRTIEQCPDLLWNDGPHATPYWRVAYHTLYFTHLYLQRRLEDFTPWERHRGEHHDLPYPPESAQPIADPYTRDDLLSYWTLCDRMVDACVDRLDLDAAGAGFPWHATMPKLEHQLHSIRHIQHHAALLSGRLRLHDGTDIGWVRTGGQKAET